MIRILLLVFVVLLIVSLVAGGTGSSISQVSGERRLGSAASRFDISVVPVRAMPMTKTGRSILRSSSSGFCLR